MFRFERTDSELATALLLRQPYMLSLTCQAINEDNKSGKEETIRRRNQHSREATQHHAACRLHAMKRQLRHIGQQ